MKRKLYQVIIILSCFFLGVMRELSTEAGTEKEKPKKTGYQITYELNGGDNSILNPTSVEREELPIVLASPKRSGYNFVGWYADPTFQHHITTLSRAEDQTCYAKWTLQINANQSVQDYPYHPGEQHLLLKNLNYQFLFALDTPGNPKTRISDLEEQKYSSEYQCPQGLCMTEDYIIVSSYALEKDALGALTFYDRNTGKYLISFGMEANSHLGGIAYDGTYIWICHSNTRKIEGISYSFLKRLIGVSSQNFIDITSCFLQYEVDNIPSCIACHDGKIYVATHHVYTPAGVGVYRFQGDHLKKCDSFLVPSKVQGLSFDEEGRVWLSRSYGRTKSSELAVYQDLEQLKANLFEPMETVEMPPGSEGIVATGGLCYVLFETASYKYLEGSDGKGTCDYPIDKLLMLDCNSLWYD